MNLGILASHSSVLGTLRKHDAADDDNLTVERGLGSNSGVRAKIIYIKKNRREREKVFLLFTYMASFKETRDLLLISRDGNLIDNEEFLLLWDMYTSRNPEYPYEYYQPFSFEEQNEAECKSNFRFEKQDIPLLFDVLGLPETWKCYQGTLCSGLEGLCIILRRFAYPCHYCDLIPIFGRPVPELCMIANQVTD